MEYLKELNNHNPAKQELAVGLVSLDFRKKDLGTQFISFYTSRVDDKVTVMFAMYTREKALAAAIKTNLEKTDVSSFLTISTWKKAIAAVITTNNTNHESIHSLINVFVNSFNC